MTLLEMFFILNAENKKNLGLNTSMLLFYFSFFLLLIGLKAVLLTMASREEITVCEDEVR